MIALGRRTVLRFAAALPLLSAFPAPAQGRFRFEPPLAPMLYTRSLERGLTGGTRLKVSRSFAVRFEREADGYRVEGEQSQVAVEAPPELEAFARLERERVETGVFPLQLDAIGTIRQRPQATENTKLDEAVREALSEISHWQLAPAERDAMRAYVETIHRSAAALVTEPPRDLFAPVDCPREETRAVALPGGGAGEVRVLFTAQRDSVTGVMREARREVVTAVAGDSRRTVESWTLAPLK